MTLPENLCNICGRGLFERHGGWYCPVHGKVGTCCEGS